mmetsp:Transcript_38352/g.92496  ORF Transcript_38352/g.92496 Transcript_38352/m.92496 type:complete len:229 (-) Transcript_38352:388-1074(-)
MINRPLCIWLLQASSCLAFSSLPSTNRAVLINSRGSSILSSSRDGDDGANPLGFIQGLFSQSSSVAAEEPKPKIPDAVVDNDYTLAAVFAVVGVSIVATNHGVGGIVGGGFITLLASLFAVQATRLRFVFDKDCFELMTLDSIGSDELKDSGDNVIVGGANRWAYTSFVNWDFYPSLEFPILVYFKETQTPQSDGDSDGQIHFFPAIANCKQLKEQFELRGCTSVERS